MPKVRVIVDQENYFDSDKSEDSLDSSPNSENENSGAENEENLEVENGGRAEAENGGSSEAENGGSSEAENGGSSEAENGGSSEAENGGSSEDENEEGLEEELQDEEKSGMASVIARILSKDTSKSNRVLLAKGKTNKEILRDISQRKRQREESNTDNAKSKHQTELGDKTSDFYQDREEKRKMWESMGRKVPSVLDNPKEVKLRKIATQGMVQLFRLVSTQQMQG